MSLLKQYLSKKNIDKAGSDVIAYLASLDHIGQKSPDLQKAILSELRDQRSYLKMIASENFCSLGVQLAMGNLLTDKYAEGFPHHRFYAGCENVDSIETLAANELKKIFGVDHAYVQPHSGADANMIAFFAVLATRVQNPEIERLSKKKIDELNEEEYESLRKLFLNQKMMGMSLNSGGHLTHGYRHNISSKLFRSVSYDVDRNTELLDYKVLQEQVQQEKPLLLIAGYSSYPRKLNFAKLKEIANSVNAVLMVDMAHFAGLVAGKAFTGEYDPAPYADIITSTTHKTLRGPRGGFVLCTKEFQEGVDKGCPFVIGGPLPHVIGSKLLAFQEASKPAFHDYAKQILLNAKALSETFLNEGVKLFTGGTDNHLMVLDVQKSFGLTGRQAEILLREAFITVNRNTVPFDQNGPWYTSGIRVGTPALTTLGMKEAEMKQIGKLIITLLKNAKPKVVNGKKSLAKFDIDSKIVAKLQAEIKEILAGFPLYPQLQIENE